MSTLKGRGGWLLGGALALFTCLGLLQIDEDGPAAFRLEDDSPLVVLNKRLRVQTGADAVVLALLVDADNLLVDEGVARIDAVYQLMASNAGLERVQAVHEVPLLQSVDGALQALTPLRPPPIDEESWQAARDLVLADPLVAGQLISEDGRAALVVGWLRQGTEADLLGSQAGQALRNPEFRQSAAGVAVSSAINEARMAVVLGESSGTASDEVARRLVALDGAGAAEVDRWRDYAVRLQTDPEAAVVASLGAALADVDGATRLFAPGMLQDAYAAAFKQSVLVFFLVLLLTLVWFISRAHGLGAAVLAGLLALLCGLSSVAATGWLGLSLHPLTVFAALSGALWFAVLAVLRLRSAWVRLIGGATLAAPLLLALPGGPALVDLRLSAACALVFALLLAEVWARLELADRPQSDRLSALFVALAGRSVPFLWLVVSVGSIAMLLARPAGIDPGSMLAAQHDLGETAALLDEHLGAASGAFLVLDGVTPGALAEPTAIGSLAAAQSRLISHPAVRSVVSWSDFVGRLHSVVSGEADSVLPDQRSLVDQYLLLFNEPARTRMFVAEDLSIAAGAVRTSRRGGAELAMIAGFLPAGQEAPALAGESVALAVAVRRQARGLLGGLLLAVLVFTGALWTRRARDRQDGLGGGLVAVPATAAVFTLAASTYLAGALGVFGVLGGSWVLGVLACVLWGHSRAETRASYDAIQLLAIVALPLSMSLATPLRAMGVGMFSGMLLAAFLVVSGTATGSNEQR